jgi:predicted phage terminase large subunit-like protein
MNLVSRVMARRGLAKFAQAVKPDYELSPFHRLMIERLEALREGTIRRLAIIASPRHGKTEIANRIFPAYAFGKDPLEKIVSVTYGAELSEQNGRAIRGYMTGPAFSKIFPHCRLSADSTAAWHFETMQGGELTACGRGGPLLGRGSTLTIIDDILNGSQEASSDAIKKSVIEWMRSTLLTRSTPTGRILCIGTRWAMDDPIDFILQQRGFEILHLPAFCNSTEDPLGRAIGEPLWPSVWTAEALEEKRVEIGNRAFQTEYQGNPAGAGGTVFKREWFRRYVPSPADQYTKIITAWDTSFGKNSQGDFSVGITIGQKKNGYDVLGLVRGRWDFPTLKAKIAFEADCFKPDEIVVEDVGAGTSVLQELREGTPYPIIGVKPTLSKEARANACTPFFESGRIFFPEGTEWVSGLEDELAGFPDGVPNDDRVDALVHGLGRLRGARDDLSLINWIRDRGEAWLMGTSKPRPVPARSPAAGACCPVRYRQRVPGGGDRCGNCGAPWIAPPIDTNGPPCVCGNTLLHIRVAGSWRCNQTGLQWRGASYRPAPQFNRKNVEGWRN